MKTVSATILIFLSWIVLGSPVAAKPSPELEKAIEAWLENDDRVALPILAGLAQTGNEDAMILLGQISLRPIGMSAYLKSLTRKERISIWKAKGGLSGKNWLTKVEQQKELAQALLKSTQVTERIDGFETLLKLGETGQSIRTLRILLDRGGYDELLYLSRIYGFPEKMKYLEYVAAILGKTEPLAILTKLHKKRLIKEADRDAAMYRMHGLIALAFRQYFVGKSPNFQDEYKIGHALWAGGMGFYSSLKYADISGGKERPRKKEQNKWMAAYKVATDLVLSSSFAKPLIGICSKRCPSETKKCVQFLYGSIPGQSGLMTIQSPVEKLISSERFFASKRYEHEVLNSGTKNRFNYWKKMRPKEPAACIASMFGT